jgi:hypothetical protein
LAYGFVGLGKFVEIFIPWEVVQPYVPFDIPAQYIPHFYGVVFTIIATFYSVFGRYAQHSIGRCNQIWHYDFGLFGDCFYCNDHLQGQTLHLPQGWRTPFLAGNLD